MPMHINEQHWIFETVDLRSQEFKHNDSISRRGDDVGRLEKFLQYLTMEHQDKKGGPLAVQEGGFNTSRTRTIGKMPPQDNGFDCGVFMCQGIDATSRGVDFDFDQSMAPQLRRLMVLEIYKMDLFQRSIGDALLPKIPSLVMDDYTFTSEEQIRLDHLLAMQLSAEEQGIDLDVIPKQWRWAALKRDLQYEQPLDALSQRLAIEQPNSYAKDVASDGACYYRAEYQKLVELGLRPSLTRSALTAAVTKERNDTVAFLRRNKDRPYNGSTLRMSMALSMLADVGTAPSKAAAAAAAAAAPSAAPSKAGAGKASQAQADFNEEELANRYTPAAYPARSS